jgi:hypothetical protein
MSVAHKDYEAAQKEAAVTVFYDPEDSGRSVIYSFAEYGVVGIE